MSFNFKILSSIFIFLTAFFSLQSQATIVQAAGSGWITSCNYSHSHSDDPIVFDPLLSHSAGKSHLHDFFGNQSTSARTVASDLLAGPTNCLMNTDKSAYWVPALYQNGKRVMPQATSKNILIYYRRGNLDSSVQVQSIPAGLKMIIGNAQATTPMDNEGIQNGKILFKCGPGSGNDKPYPPQSCSSGVMVIHYEFPQCWDGKNLDSSNHKSHMAYPMRGICPTSHSVAIPRIEAFIRYPVGTSPIGNVTIASGAYYSAHADFFNGWDPMPLQRLVDKCINGNMDCGKNPSL